MCALVKVDLLKLTELKDIGCHAFEMCLDLTDFAFPPNVITIKFKTLFNCSSFANVKLPASLQTIEMGAIPTPSSNFCLEASESMREAGLPAILRMKKRKGILKIAGAAGSVISCRLEKTANEIASSFNISNN